MPAAYRRIGHDGKLGLFEVMGLYNKVSARADKLLNGAGAIG